APVERSDRGASLGRLEHPHLVLVPPGRMRHREAAQHRLTALDVDQHSPARLVLPPAAGDVGLAERSDVAGLVVDSAEAVQMAAVLRAELRDERRLPAGNEAVLCI